MDGSARMRELAGKRANQRVPPAAVTDRRYSRLNRSPQPARDTVRDRMDHVMVDVLGDLAGKMRRPVGHSLAWKCDCIWGAKKRTHHAYCQNQNVAFHVQSLPLRLDCRREGRIREIFLLTMRFESIW